MAAWVNSQGNEVATKPQTFQLDLPTEQATAASVGAINIIAVVMAVVQLITAMQSGNPAAIIAAFQALVKAIMGT